MQSSSKNTSVVFLLLLLFCFTLDVQSVIAFYGTQFFGLTLLLIYRFIVYPYINLNSLKLLMFMVCLLEFMCFIQYLYINDIIMVLIYQKVIFLISVSLLLFDYIKLYDIKKINKALSIYIIFLSCTIFIQFIGFYILHLDKAKLDVGVLLGGSPARTEYLGEWVYRPTSITSEPSVFVGIQFGLLVLQYFIDEKAKLTRIIGIISICLSMSFLGLILVFLYLAIVYSKNIKNYIFGSLALFLFYLFSFEMINARIEAFLDGDDGSNNVKLEVIEYFFSDINITLGGYGFLASSDNTPVFYNALGDLTFFINTFTIFGLILGAFIMLYFVIFLIKSKSSVKEKALICLSLIKLSNPAFMFFSCFFLVLIVILNKRQ
ncbi:hypothetical protein I5554_18625 [Acinetobacter sp. TGL-Y2]|nr:hypothetical protein [Acinetobacter bereziniae]MBJ9374073.1 hypothetical protein [Acinetobacter sp. TGL-Y2]